MAEEPEMTVAQVAKRLGVGKATVQRRIKTGELAVINVGTALRKKLRVSETDYQRYLASRRITRGRAA